jgi:hypothetical protein
MSTPQNASRSHGSTSPRLDRLRRLTSAPRRLLHLGFIPSSLSAILGPLNEILAHSAR